MGTSPLSSVIRSRMWRIKFCYLFEQSVWKIKQLWNLYQRGVWIWILNRLWAQAASDSATAEVYCEVRDGASTEYEGQLEDKVNGKVIKRSFATHNKSARAKSYKASRRNECVNIEHARRWRIKERQGCYHRNFFYLFIYFDGTEDKYGLLGRD